jgi:hypothetical protein
MHTVLDMAGTWHHLPVLLFSNIPETVVFLSHCLPFNTFFPLLMLVNVGSVIRDVEPDPESGFGLLHLERMQHFLKSKIELSVIFVSFSAIITV